MSSFLRHEACQKCGSSDAKAVYDDGGEHCFSCGFHKHGDALSRHRAHLGARSRRIYDYEDTRAIPAVPMMWLQKYGLTEAELQEFSWDKNRQHLIFRQDGFSNARNFDPQDDRKYVSYGDKPYAVRGDGDWLVCVEDAISGIKVSRHIACMILYGSTVPLDRVIMAMNQYKGVLFWLDPDKIKESAMMAKNLRQFGFDVRTIPATMDPKDYDDAKIREILQEFV